MYLTDGALPRRRLPAGTALAVVGPPLTGKEDLLIELLAAGATRGEDVVLVVTDGDLPTRLLDRLDEEHYDRVTVVDAAGDPVDADVSVRRLSSPADLTGIAIGVTEALAAADEEGRGARVAVHSLTNVAPHVGTERLVRLVNELAERVRTAGALGLFSVHGEDPEQGIVARVGPAFDGRVEVRQSPPAVRVVGLDDGPTDWQPLDRAAPTAVGSTAGLPDPGELPDSLHEVVSRVASRRLTLSLCNVDTAVESAVSGAFDRRGVEVVTTTADAMPDDLAVLSRDREFLAADVASRLRDELTVDSLSRGERSPVVAAMTGPVFDVDGVGRRPLVDASRRFETAAARHGGTVHAGFQSLSRLAADPETVAVYRALVDAGVEVHLYGRRDAAPPAEGATVHDEGGELDDTWFVVYDGGDDPDAAGALLAEVTGPSTYRGFWTGDPDVTAELLGYLEATYLANEAAA